MLSNKIHAHIQKLIKFKKIDDFTLKDVSCLRGLKVIGGTKLKPTDKTSETETILVFAQRAEFKDKESDVKREAEKQIKLSDSFTTSAILHTRFPSTL